MSAHDLRHYPAGVLAEFARPLPGLPALPRAAEEGMAGLVSVAAVCMLGRADSASAARELSKAAGIILSSNDPRLCSAIAWLAADRLAGNMIRMGFALAGAALVGDPTRYAAKLAVVRRTFPE